MLKLKRARASEWGFLFVMLLLVFFVCKAAYKKVPSLRKNGDYFDAKERWNLDHNPNGMPSR